MTRPVRIHLSRKKGWRMPLNTVKVDRTTKWGNVYRVGMFKNFGAADAIDAFRARLKQNLHDDARRINADIAELRGKNLACWCRLCNEHAAGKPLGILCSKCDPCHADVLIEIANQ